MFLLCIMIMYMFIQNNLCTYNIMKASAYILFDITTSHITRHTVIATSHNTHHTDSHITQPCTDITFCAISLKSLLLLLVVQCCYSNM